MKKGKFQKNSGNKMLALVLALTLLVGGAIGGTVAWLLDKTDAVKNTFTPSDISIELDETKPVDKTAKMIPGWTIEKDPAVTVEEGSEDCYVFVKVEKSKLFDTYMECSIADTWTELESAAGPGFKVYYMTFDSKDTNAPAQGTAYPVLEGNKVTVKADVTKEMMEAITADVQPTLSFTAYASQLYKNNTDTFSAAEAWANIS